MAFSTVVGHLIEGEERFSVEFREQDSSVWLDLYSVSRGSGVLGKVGCYPNVVVACGLSGCAANQLIIFFVLVFSVCCELRALYVSVVDLIAFSAWSSPTIRCCSSGTVNRCVEHAVSCLALEQWKTTYTV